MPQTGSRTISSYGLCHGPGVGQFNPRPTFLVLSRNSIAIKGHSVPDCFCLPDREGQHIVSSIGRLTHRANALLAQLKGARLGHGAADPSRRVLAAGASTMAAIVQAGGAIFAHRAVGELSPLGRCLARLGSQLHAAELSDLPERDVLRFAEEICQLADDTHRFVSSLPPGERATVPSPPPEKMVGAR